MIVVKMRFLIHAYCNTWEGISTNPNRFSSGLCIGRTARKRRLTVFLDQLLFPSEIEGGQLWAWNATVIHTCAPSRLRSTAEEPEQVPLPQRNPRKTSTPPCKSEVTISGLAVETLCAFRASALGLDDEISRCIRFRTNDLAPVWPVWQIAAVVHAAIVSYACLILDCKWITTVLLKYYKF